MKDKLTVSSPDGAHSAASVGVLVVESSLEHATTDAAANTVSKAALTALVGRMMFQSIVRDGTRR